MITNGRLGEVASKLWAYGNYSTYHVKEPIGVDCLPKEWEDKLGFICPEFPELAHIENVHLLGPALVGEVDGKVLLDTAYSGRIDVWERNMPYFHVAMEAKKLEAKRVEHAVSFAGVWSSNYFHWILDFLPKLEGVQKYEEETGVRPLVLLTHMAPKFATDTLDLLGYEYEKIETGHYLVENLCLPTTRRHKGYVDPDAVEWLRDAFEYPYSHSEGLYISRDNAETRRVVNDKELLKSDNSLATMQSENYDFEIQQITFKGCRYITGPHGAGLVNMIWAEEPVVIELVTPAYSNPCCWLIAAAMGWKYGFVICEPTGVEDMIVDVDKYMRVKEMMG